MAHPDNLAIIRNARVALRDLADVLSDRGHVETLKAVDAALNELALREDEEFFRDQCDRGREIVGLLGQAIGEDSSVRGYHDLERLAQQVQESLPSDISENESLMSAIADWELRLYAHRMRESSADLAGISGQAGFTREAFQSYLAERFPEATDIRVTKFEELPVGFSKKTIIVELSRPLLGASVIVVRAEPNVRLIEIDGADPRREFPTVQLAWQAGLPVAEPLWVEGDGDRLGMRFFVSRKAEGHNLGTLNSVGGAVPDEVVDDLARHLVRLHAIRLDAADAVVQESHLVDWLGFETIEQSTSHFVQYWRGLVAKAEIGASPILEIGLSWMERNVPQSSEQPAFLHADYGLHNVLVAANRVSAILDWETSHMGDPAEDITHFLTFTDGVDREKFLAAYASHGGAVPSAFRLAYFDVFQCVLMIGSCLVALSRLHASATVSPKLLVLGVMHMEFFAGRLVERIRDANACRDGRG